MFSRQRVHPILKQAGWLRSHERTPLSTFCPLRRNIAELYKSEKRPETVMDPEIKALVAKGEMMPPRRPPVFQPSQEWTQSIRKTMEGPLSEKLSHLHEYREAGLELQKHLKHRKPPLEGGELKQRQKKIDDKIAAEFGPEILELQDRPSEIRKRMKRLENAYIHKWAPIEFDETGAITYLVTRSAGEFATLKRIFNEIKNKNPQFQPRTLFDFGSGLTTGLWAFKDTFGAVTEAFCVDPSKEMNDLSRLILAEGSDNMDIPAGISFRLHNPATINLEYDVVLSSHSLLELDGQTARLESIHSLWSRVQEGGVLVILESGTNAGFQLVTEARDYLVQVSHLASTGQAKEGLAGHVMAPCPHDLPCPKYHQDTAPCNFTVRYNNFDLPGLEPSTTRYETFSYVVFKKGARETESFPRLVEPPVKTKGSFYCRLCTSQGGLQEVLCKKSADLDLFQLTKRLGCGDDLPVKLLPWVKKEKIGTPWMKRQQREKFEKHEKDNIERGMTEENV